MRSFGDHHPVVVTVYFLAAAGICMFCMDPVILGLSLMGAVLCALSLRCLGGPRAVLGMLALLACAALINPLVSHHGVTVLFVMNHNPVTLEALVYGVAAAGMIGAVMVWFRAFTSVMTSDKLLCVFGSLSPRLALMLSMALRYVPLFTRQLRAVSASQRALGLYREDNLIDRLRGGLRVFSVMVTWTLENGVITADSMTARGYGTVRRTRFAIFRWTAQDVSLLLTTLLLAALTLWGLGAREFAYYPQLSASVLNAQALTGFIAYGLLTLLPLIVHGKEALRWHCLKSRI